MGASSHSIYSLYSCQFLYMLVCILGFVNIFDILCETVMHTSEIHSVLFGYIV